MIETVKMDGRVSAVVTAYNCVQYIGEALESVLSQTRPPDEIVVVDDGSRDGTPDVVANFPQNRIRLIVQENRGPGAARNRGIMETSGEFLAFLDGDDIWLADKTALQLAYLQSHPHVALVSGDEWLWDIETDERWLGGLRLKPYHNLSREILIHNLVGNPSMVMLRRSILQRVGLFDTTLPWGQDWELWIRIATRAPIGYLTQPVIIYRKHSAGVTYHRRWERLDCLERISLQAIAEYQPAIWRPLLSLRARSKASYYRAKYANKKGWPAKDRWGLLLKSLIQYPFEMTSDKLKLLGRMLTEDARHLRRRRQPRSE